jgi:hypothetical protein
MQNFIRIWNFIHKNHSTFPFSDFNSLRFIRFKTKTKHPQLILPIQDEPKKRNSNKKHLNNKGDQANFFEFNFFSDLPLQNFQPYNDAISTIPLFKILFSLPVEHSRLALLLLQNWTENKGQLIESRSGP